MRKKIITVVVGVVWIGFWSVVHSFEKNHDVRESAVAGVWYSDKPQRLKQMLDGFLDQVKPASNPVSSGTLRALLAPHAGYRYSGKTAANAYHLIKNKHYKRIVIMGPAHRHYFHGLSIIDKVAYRTPLGDIPIDKLAVQRLKKHPLINTVKQAHITEHAIEMQLPFLQHVLSKGWQLVPILVGDLDENDIQEVASTIQKVIDQETLLIVSGDFTHYGPDYGYVPFIGSENVSEKIKQLDMGAYQFIAEMDSDQFYQYKLKTGLTACATGPVRLLLKLLPKTVNPVLLKYMTSGQLLNDDASSVSYLAIAFYEPENLILSHADALSEQDMKLLHQLAKQALQWVTQSDVGSQQKLKLLQDDQHYPEYLKSLSGAFVTLKKSGQLRGCIGTIYPSQPLFKAIVNNAVHAAKNDYRFDQVEEKELGEMDIEVSVLSPPRLIDSVMQFVVGKHGIIMTKDGERAVFLPEVAPEQGWSREETLMHLSLKAGLKANAWKKGATFEVFTSQKYSAPYQ